MENETQISDEIIEKLPLPVDGEEILATLNSEDFKKLLNSAAKHTNQTGYESGFDIKRDIYSGTKKFSQIEKGNTFSIEARLREDYYHQEYSPSIINLHFHPTDPNEGLLIPSLDRMHQSLEGDLLTLNFGKTITGTFYDIDYRPLMIIGQIDDQGNKKLLIIQELYRGSLEEMSGTADVIIDGLDEAASQEEVLDTLRENMYRAELINLNTDNEISPQDQEKIKSFSIKFTIENEAIKDGI